MAIVVRKPDSQAETAKARALLQDSIDGCVSAEPAWTERGLPGSVPQAVAGDVETLCDGRRFGYRDAALGLLAFSAANEVIYNITDRFSDDRTTSNWLGSFLKSRNIPCVQAALQNASFRGSFVHERIRSPELRRILTWASSEERTPREVGAVFDRIARRAADTARVIEELPELDATRFTFPRTLAVTDDLLSAPSRGAAEQYIFAALKTAEIEAIPERMRVTTKDINAADAGRVAGDVQVVRGQAEVIDAFEVTGNSWTEKIVQASEVIRAHGLAEAHIVADADHVMAADIAEELAAAPLPGTVSRSTLDLSVLDLRNEVRSLISRLSKSGRVRFVQHLWQMLVDYHEDRLVEQLVEVIRRLELQAH